MPTFATAAPMDSTQVRVTSPFGVRRSLRDPSRTRMHAGLDLSTRDGSEGLPVYSVAPGRVFLVARDGQDVGMRGYGNAVVVKHEFEDTYALYAHLRSITVREGQKVSAGDQVGTVGNTSNGLFSPRVGETPAQYRARMTAAGEATRVMAPHLHFEVRVPRPNGEAPFPGPYPSTPAEARYHRDPQRWLGDKGMTFESRGGVTFAPKRVSVAGLGADYEPPLPDRDARFGLTPGEWRAVALGAFVGVGALVLYVARK